MASCRRRRTTCSIACGSIPPDPKAALPERIFVRLAPGTPAAFEETLVRKAMAAAGAWSFEVEPLDAMRVDKLRSTPFR